MTITQGLSTASQAMHGRAHAFYNTTCPDGCEDAGKWAARRLITPRAFLTARRNSHSMDGMADHLGVEPVDVFNYISALDPDEWLIMVRLTGDGPH